MPSFVGSTTFAVLRGMDLLSTERPSSTMRCCEQAEAVSVKKVEIDTGKWHLQLMRTSVLKIAAYEGINLQLLVRVPSLTR